MSGLKTPSSYYIELITSFPPRPITNENELIATQNRMNSILDNVKLIQDDKDYLKVLATLIEDYEAKHEHIPTLMGVELLKALLEESNLQSQDLLPIFKDESRILDILNGKSQLTANEIENLAASFKIFPRYFIHSNSI